MVTFFILVYLLSWGSYQKTALQVKNQATTVNFLLILSGMIEPSSVCGFLCPFFSYTEGWGGEVKIGKLLQGLVRTIDKVRKVVYLSSDPDTMSKSVVCFLCIHHIVFLVSIFNDSQFPFDWLFNLLLNKLRERKERNIQNSEADFY